MKIKMLKLAVIVLLLTSCQNNVTNKNIAGNIAMSQSTAESNSKSYLHNEDSNNKIADEDTKNRAEKITNKIKQIDNIKDVSVVISDKFALIGIDLYQDISDKHLITLKNEITSLVKKCDNNIAQVSVTATPSLVRKITDKSDFSSENIVPPKLSGGHKNLIELTPGF